jgi:hypothetical protein
MEGVNQEAYHVYPVVVYWSSQGPLGQFSPVFNDPVAVRVYDVTVGCCEWLPLTASCGSVRCSSLKSWIGMGMSG